LFSNDFGSDIVNNIMAENYGQFSQADKGIIYSYGKTRKI